MRLVHATAGALALALLAPGRGSAQRDERTSRISLAERVRWRTWPARRHDQGDAVVPLAHVRPSRLTPRRVETR